MADPTHGSRLEAGAIVAPRQLTDISGESVTIPAPEGLTHLELRRFAGCPICNLHLRSVVQRRSELAAAGVREVVVFHSTPEEMRKYQAELPLTVIADPTRKLYAEFGVESAPRSVLNPRAWPAVFGGLFNSIGAAIKRKAPPPPMGKHEGGSFGLPGDFLIAADGRLAAAKYGTHAYDQWTVDEVLALARAEREGGGSEPARLASDASVTSSSSTPQT